MGKDEYSLLTAMLQPSFSIHLSLLLCLLPPLPFLSSSLPSSSIQCTRAYMNCVSAQFRGCRLALQYQLSRKLYSERVACMYMYNYQTNYSSRLEILSKNYPISFTHYNVSNNFLIIRLFFFFGSLSLNGLIAKGEQGTHILQQNLSRVDFLTLYSQNEVMKRIRKRLAYPITQRSQD